MSSNRQPARPVHPLVGLGVLVWLGGGIGAVLRYLIQHAYAQSRSGELFWFSFTESGSNSPSASSVWEQINRALGITSSSDLWSLLVINLLGCFVIGWVSVMLLRVRRRVQWHAVLVPGFLGGFTSFSSCISLVSALGRGSMTWWGVAYFVVTTALCVVLAWSGGQIAERMIAARARRREGVGA